MMRFLGLAVTLGFFFIGWRIEQSILNPLLNKQKKKTISKNKKLGKKSYESKDSLIERSNDKDEESKNENNGDRYSYNGHSNSISTNNASAMNDETQAHIRSKKKQLGIMWFIIYVILFIGFYEMVYSSVQRIAKPG